jgi:hypothetical protein
VHVAALRRALGGGRYIKTVPLRGYCFVARVLRGDSHGRDNGSADWRVPLLRPQIPNGGTGQELMRSLSQLADHASLLGGRGVTEIALNVTAREAALLNLQILALNAALTEVLGRRRGDFGLERVKGIEPSS